MKRKSDTKFHRFICFIFGWLFYSLYRLRVVGRENEPENGGFLVCSNHISAVDPILITAAMSHQICFMGKKELFKIPLLSSLLRALGAFPVDRSGADVSAVKNSIRLLKEGRCVGMFPQGTRQPGKNPRETAVRNGAAMIAYRADVTVVPVFIHRKDHTPRLFRKTTIVIGKPIPFSEFHYDPEAKGEYNRIANEIFDRVCELGEGIER